MAFGYNFGGTYNKINPAERTVGIVVENFCVPNGQGVAQTELHLTSTDTNNVEHRFFTASEAVDGTFGKVSIDGS